MNGCCGSPEDLAKLEKQIEEKVAAYGRSLYVEELQRISDGFPHVGSNGVILSEGRQVECSLLTPYGSVKLRCFCGRNRETGSFETPFKTVFCRAARHPVTPLLERRLLVTACETGSFEKASGVCAEWGCPVSDDKIHNLIVEVGNGCSDKDLPTQAAEAAGTEDVLVIMMDGWLARFRGEGWGETREAMPGKDHVNWRESKSAVMFKLSQAVDVSNKRRMLVAKHIVIEPALTTPEEFGKKVYAEAVRMGALTARKVYVIMDGGTYLWNVYDLEFSALAEGTLDYYHASQHLGVLAEHLFCDVKDPALKESWLAQRRSELKHNGAKSLLDALNKVEVKVVSNEDSAKVVMRECAYFRKHADHMDYDRNTLLGIPIGSGAMESQCSQNQNRFKRRGQFWSEEGFAAFTQVYVRYMNNELCYCYRKRAA